MKKIIQKFALLYLLSLSACVSWPPQGRGGMAEQYLAHKQNSLLKIEKSQKDVLFNEHQDLSTMFNLLIQKGARDCFPATVHILKSRYNRISRELDADMNEDASTGLLIQRYQISKLSNKLDYVINQRKCKPNTELEQPTVNTRDDIQDEKNIATESNTKKIQTLLNSDNQFAFNSSVINPKYITRLNDALEELFKIDDFRLVITGHADTFGSENSNIELSKQRALSVKNYLITKKINPDVISIKPFGSSQPLFNGNEIHIRLVNRRTNIQLLTPPYNTSTILGN